MDTFSQHQEPEKTPDRETELETESEAEAKPEPAPAPVEQKAFTFVTQKIRGAAIDSKWGRRVNLSSDDFMAPPSGGKIKRGLLFFLSCR